MKTQLPMLLLLAFSTCSCSSGDIEGVVRFRNGPAEGARVSIGTMTTTTNADGAFSFNNVPEGSRQLTAQLDLSDGRFVVAHETVEVQWLTPNVLVQLPPSIELYGSTLTPGAVTLRWTPMTTADFHEYRVSRTPLEALPPLTIHIEHCVGNVTYFDHGDVPGSTFPPGADLYYRVVAVDSIGLIAQSNLLKMTIPPFDAATSIKRYSVEEKQSSAREVEPDDICWDGNVMTSSFWAGSGK